MVPLRPVVCAVLFVLAIAFVIRANVIFYRILDEVNATRQGRDQISFLFVRLRLAEVMSEHGRRFPVDRKRQQIKSRAQIDFDGYPVYQDLLGNPIGTKGSISVSN